MRSIIWAFGIIISFLYVGAAAKDRQCPESCDESRCGEQLVKCSSGFYTKDKCGCCNVCLRLRNEQCGGRNDNFGKCAQGLKCVKDNIDVFMNDDEPNEDEEKEEMTGTCQGAQDCILSPWSSWSKCSKQCGFGTMKRRRVVLQLPKNGGKPCPAKHEKKGCFRQNCEGDMVLAQILPAEYRRQPFGSYKFDKILPQKKKLTEIQKIRKRFRSHCVNFKLLSKHPYCEGTWAEKLKMSKPMCVECQPAIMDDQGFCKGEGIAGNFTSWIATNAKTCSGLWMRVGEKIPNCKCIDQKFQNFIFV